MIITLSFKEVFTTVHFELLVISFQGKKGSYCLQTNPLGVSAYVGS